MASNKVKITILASEWGSSWGESSTLIRELAIQLAKSSSVEITFFVPQCSDEDEKEALRHNVHVLKATPLPGFEELEWLSFPPQHHQFDIIVGHGVKLGRQAQVIKKSHKCKWVQVVHTDPEELGMFKSYPTPIIKGDEKHSVEIELCETADFVVGIGPKLIEAFRTYLRWVEKDKTIFDLTPSVFDEFINVKQVPEERKHRSILVFGRGDADDFKSKGIDIAARAVAALPETHLVFVGAPKENLEEVAQRFLHCGVPANRLSVRSYDKSRETLKGLFCEVDLFLVSSRTGGFGLSGLEALSAGLPVLISKNSGFGEALSKVPFGSSFVIDSEDPERWAAAIKKLWEKGRQSRLKEAEALRSSYERQYSWSKQSGALLFRMMQLVEGRDYTKEMEALLFKMRRLLRGRESRLKDTTEEMEALSFKMRGLLRGERRLEEYTEEMEPLLFKIRHLLRDQRHLEKTEKREGLLFKKRHQLRDRESGLEEIDALRSRMRDQAHGLPITTENVEMKFGMTELRPPTTIADEENRAGESDFMKHSGFKLLKSLLEDTDILETICELLDTPVPGFDDYKAVAKHYGFGYFKIKSLLEKSDEGPSKALIEALVNRNRKLTVEEFAATVEKIAQRKDVAKLLRGHDSTGQSPFGPKLLKSLLEDTDILETICEPLDTPVPGFDDYKAMAKHFGFGYFKFKSLLKKSDEGPSKALIEALVNRNRKLTVEEFAATVEKIAKRQDVAKLLRGFSYSDDRDNNKSDTKEKDDKGKMDDGDGDSPSEEIIEGGEHLLRQQHQVEEAAKKTRVHEGTVTNEGIHWDLKLGAVHLTFPSDAVTEPTFIVVHKWESSVCSPQLQEHEAIVSNVIEISTTTNEALQFNVKVKLVFSHCAPNLQGYELVIKRLINKETNDWEEVEGIVDARQLSDIEDDYPNEVPDFSFPVVQADIAECSIFTVICRLIPSPTFTISSRGGCFHHPDYPGVAVTVPKKAVSVKSKFPLQLKVQEVPNDEFEGRNVYVGPILRISCTQGIEFLKPVTIQLPVAPRVEGGAIPDPSICRVRVLFLRSDGENKEWVDITDDLENPARFEGTSVTFQVKRFSGYVYFIEPNTGEVVRAVDQNCLWWLHCNTWTPTIMASFFAYFRPSERIRSRDLLHLVCCPAHLRSEVKEELIYKDGVSPREVYEINSNRAMIPGHDKVFVFVSGGISPVNEEYMGEVYLLLDACCQHKNQLPIRLISDQEYCLVEFHSFAKLRFILPSRQMQGEASPGFRVKAGGPTDEELQAIAGKIGGKWKALGRQLKIEEAQLIGFDRDQPDEYEKAYLMLVEWKQRGGSENANYQILKEALCHALVGRRDLAEEFCCLLGSF